jgi:lysophospholipase L1-like esterase
MPFRFITPLFSLTLLIACTYSSPMISNPDAVKSKYQFLSLGDSYTIGESVDAADRWSVQLAGMLRKNGLDVADPAIIARTGWTTADLQDAIKAANDTKTYDLVSLLIGVNNQYRGQSSGRYRTEFRDLLQTAIRFASNRANHVFVLSIPDWGESPYASGRDQKQIATEIDTFNVIAKEECQKAGVAFVDITPLTRQATGDTSQFAGDGLHYSGKQMKLWAEKAKPVVEGLLNR